MSVFVNSLGRYDWKIPLVLKKLHKSLGRLASCKTTGILFWLFFLWVCSWSFLLYSKSYLWKLGDAHSHNKKQNHASWFLLSKNKGLVHFHQYKNRGWCFLSWYFARLFAKHSKKNRKNGKVCMLLCKKPQTHFRRSKYLHAAGSRLTWVVSFYTDVGWLETGDGD